MFSDMIELLGLACLVAGVFVLLGLGAALLAAGACFLFVGTAVDDAAISRALRARIAAVRAVGPRVTAGWRNRRGGARAKAA